MGIPSSPKATPCILEDVVDDEMAIVLKGSLETEQEESEARQEPCVHRRTYDDGQTSIVRKEEGAQETSTKGPQRNFD
jgi:hypothetical protein